MRGGLTDAKRLARRPLDGRVRRPTSAPKEAGAELAHCEIPNLADDRARALAASTSRLRGSAVVTSEWMSTRADEATSSTVRSNAASFAFDGTLTPLSFLTN